jgi:hypothetical protein
MLVLNQFALLVAFTKLDQQNDVDGYIQYGKLVEPTKRSWKMLLPPGSHSLKLLIA